MTLCAAKFVFMFKMISEFSSLIRISFADEPVGTYRLYTYKWISENEYDLKSIQYNDKNEPTGYFYGGTFIRINTKK